MTPHEIPGFFFDNDKQKYFRIQKNHVLPAGSAYTHGSVKALKDASDREARRVQHVNRVRLGRVTRAPWSATSSILNLRLGGRSTPHRTLTEIYARGLTSKPAVCDEWHIPLNQRESLGACFIDEEGCLLAPHMYGLPFSRRRPADAGNFAYALSYAPQVINPGPIQITSIAAIDGYYMCTDGETFMQSGRAPYDPFRRGAVPRRGDPGLRVRSVSVPPEVQIWDIAASRASSGLIMFALATNEGLLLSSVDGSGFATQRGICHGLRREQMNLTFFQPNVVMSGERSGRVNLMDVRTPDESVARLHHSSAVLCTSSTRTQSEILVQGFSTMSIYDLRYNKAQPPPKRPLPRKRNFSTPCLDFAVPTDRQSDQFTIGGPKMVYSSDLDLVVAASCRNTVGPMHDKISRVTLYSAKTGRTVRSPLNDYVFDSPVQSLFMKRIRDGPESIVTFGGGLLLEWTVHGEHVYFNEGDGRDSTLKQLRAVNNGVEDVGQTGIVRAWERGNQGPI